MLATVALAASMSACARTDDTVGIVVTSDASTAGDVCVAGPSLKHRPEAEAVTLVAGMFESTSGTTWSLLRRDQYVTLQGQGYLSLRWQIEYAIGAGLIVPPTFTVQSGSYLHVGGGGGKNMGDPRPGTTGTWLGNAEEGISFMPEGVPTPWQNEFYYLDGEVTITQHESGGLYNVVVYAQTYDDLVSPDWGVYDPGVVCDPS
jgi:hypothetical protein